MKFITPLLPLLSLVFIVGCVTDGVGTRTDFSGISTSVATAQTAAAKAAANAATIASTGAKPGDAVTKELQVNIADTQAALIDSNAEVARAKAANAEQADAANATINDQKAQISKFPSKLNHWAIFAGIAFIVAAGLAIAAPLIVTSLGVGAVITQIPILGGIVGTGERIVVVIAGGVAMTAIAGIGKLFGIL